MPRSVFLPLFQRNIILNDVCRAEWMLENFFSVMSRVYIIGVKKTKCIYRNGNVKSLFDPSNTEVNTVEDNMDK